MSSGRESGFTLVEMVVVIVISSILAGVVTQFITQPMEAYADQGRRNALVDAADGALRRMSREIREALPNSVRVGCGGNCVEFLRALDGGRYRAVFPGDALSFNPADMDSSFDVIGPVARLSQIVTGAGPGDCLNAAASCLVVYNTGLLGTNAYNSDNIATVTAASAGPPISLSFDNSNFSSGSTAFPASSPAQRFHIVDTPVAYLCDISQGTLRRYEGYTISANQGSVDTHAELIGLPNPAEHAFLANRVSNCSFAYSPGTPARNGLATLSLSLSDQGESVTLLQQVHISNTP